MKWEVSDEHMESDHYPIFVIWSNYTSFHKITIRSKFNLNKLDIKKYNEEIKKAVKKFNPDIPLEAYKVLVQNIQDNLIDS